MSNTGRYRVIDMKTGKWVTVEPVDDKKNRSRSWGDIDPATKTVNGNYGNKYNGAVEEKDSIMPLYLLQLVGQDENEDILDAFNEIVSLIKESPSGRGQWFVVPLQLMTHREFESLHTPKSK